MTPATTPKVGFVSLGCPKATVDSEQVITQLRAEGYAIESDFAVADMVIVNTCGFIDAAVEESLQSIDEAMQQNGRVIVTGCLGARAELIRERFPSLLAVTGPPLARLTQCSRQWVAWAATLVFFLVFIMFMIKEGLTYSDLP